ncbi:flippase-like domain-containing protein [Oscillochloris sp. ZM17-4]|uniref:lysylphosphatidylglycerol synthase transmembrane domain-containing protein n=1 Tax=Oscillochloris sp. ZM17-4 TaxID=2866714 RepID=UPI001C73CCD3|nr:lysylphosphatidylglycerol synthase transmembrane domain-containing protein [Oscillochloris sp. ZM17-4]MBX0328716.1 flippase-like domain-containing protein [Oscillochloris sp. ZM17-4]
MMVAGEERRPTWRGRLVLGGRLALAGGLLAVVAWRLTDWPTLRAVFTGARPGYLIGCILIYYLGVWISCVKWRLLLQAQGTISPLGPLLRWYLAGAFAGSFLPSDVGGDLGRGYLASRVIADKAALWSSIIAERLTGLAGMALLAAVSLAFAPALLGWSPIVPLGILAVCALVGVAVAYLLVRATAPSWTPDPLLRGLERVREVLRAYSRSTGILVRCVGLSLIYHLMTVLSLSLILLALDTRASVSAALVAPLVGLVGLLPLSPGGLGVREGVLAALLGRAGVAGGVALAAALTSRALLWLTALSGLPVLLAELGLLKVAAADRGPPTSAPFEGSELNHDDDSATR